MWFIILLCYMWLGWAWARIYYKWLRLEEGHQTFLLVGWCWHGALRIAKLESWMFITMHHWGWGGKMHTTRPTLATHGIIRDERLVYMRLLDQMCNSRSSKPAKTRKENAACVCVWVVHGCWYIRELCIMISYEKNEKRKAVEKYVTYRAAPSCGHR